MTVDNSKNKTNEATSKGKKPKKKELITLDDNMLMLARELFKHISPLTLEINQHANRKTIIINQDELNQYMAVNVKLAQIKGVKKIQVNILDNDVLELELDIETFESKANLKKHLKIDNVIMNSDEALIKLSFQEESTVKTNELLSKLLLLVNKYILKTLLLPELIKHFQPDDIKVDWQTISIDLKNGNLKEFYEKTINQILNTSVPYFGNKHLMDLLEVESIMCEKGQMWIDIIYKIE